MPAQSRYRVCLKYGPVDGAGYYICKLAGVDGDFRLACGIGHRCCAYERLWDAWKISTCHAFGC